MESAQQTYEKLYKRCNRYQSQLYSKKILKAYSNLMWPILALLLGVLFLLKMLTPKFDFLIYSTPIILMIGMGFIFYHRKKWVLDHWKITAFADRETGSKGEFLFAIETNNTQLLSKKVPVIQFPKQKIYQFFIGWVALIAGFVLWYSIPHQITRSIVKEPFIPQPIRKVENLLDLLKKQVPDEKRFIQEAQEELIKMQQNAADGLKAEDFQALDNLQNQALAKMQSSLAETQKQLNALNQLSNNLNNLSNNPAKELEKLSRQLQALKKQLPQGLSNDALKKQLEALSKEAKKLSKQLKGSGKGQSGFNQKKMQELLKKMQGLQSGLQKKLNKGKSQFGGKGGIKKGYAPQSPLNFTHQPKSGKRKFKNELFRAYGNDATVLLGSVPTGKKDTGIQDQQGLSKKGFQKGTSTQFKDQQFRPKYQAMLKSYFNK